MFRFGWSVTGKPHGRVGVLARNGDQFPIVNFELVGTATFSRPCLGLGGR